jgi:Fe-S-cluster-containing hydrogenase component 2
MVNPPLEDLFEPYESQYVRDLEGRLIKVEAAKRDDLETMLTVTVDGTRMENVPMAVPATDDQGNIIRDKEGNVVPRLTTVYDAASWRYQETQGARFRGPDPKNPIPVLCHQPHQKPLGLCRVCSVMTTRDGRAGDRLIPGCQHPLVNGMEFHTVASLVKLKFPESEMEAGRKLKEKIRVLLLLLAANTLHQDQPENDRRYLNELLLLLRRFGVPVESENGELRAVSPYKRREYDPARIDDSSPVIRVDHNNCILCDRCVRGCSDVKPFKVIGHTGFGNQARISFDLGKPMKDSSCVSCGECATSCPTGALTFKGSIYTQGGQKPRDPWKDESLKPVTVKAEELEKMPLFAGVPYSFLKWNEGAVGRVDATAGQVLCKQGEYGSTAFIMESGTVDVMSSGRKVATLDKSEYILGEMACLTYQARTAALQAGSGGAKILVVKRNMLHMLQRNPTGRGILAPIYRRRALDSYLRRGQLFGGLDDSQSKAAIEFLKDNEGVDFVQVDPGQAVFLQGQKADSFYIVYLGHLSISDSDARGHVTIRNYIGQGRAFGEIGLLSDPDVSPTVAALSPAKQGQRTATVTAMDHVELVRVSGKAFVDLMERYPDIREKLEETACKIDEQNKARRHEVGHLMGDFTQAGLYQGQNLLVLELNRCTRCQECVKACADSHGGTTRLILEGNRFAEYLVPSACRSCHDPMCLTGCPVDAIHRKPANPKRPGAQSLAIVIEDHCIGCSLCSKNCPYGSIHMHLLPDGRRTATKWQEATNCDLCESLDGNPRCVHHCPHDAAMRMTGEIFAQRVGLSPVGPAALPTVKP